MGLGERPRWPPTQRWTYQGHLPRGGNIRVTYPEVDISGSPTQRWTYQGHLPRGGYIRARGCPSTAQGLSATLPCLPAAAQLLLPVLQAPCLPPLPALKRPYAFLHPPQQTIQLAEVPLYILFVFKHVCWLLLLLVWLAYQQILRRAAPCPSAALPDRLLLLLLPLPLQLLLLLLLLAG